MPAPTQEHRLPLPALVTLASVTAFVVAALGFLAWPLRLPLLATAAPGAPAMNPLTSLCIALAALALWSSRRAGATAAGRWQTVCCALAVTVLSAWRLSDLASRSESGIDLLLFREQLEAWSPPSRMGFYSAFSLVLMGPGLLLLDSSRAYLRLCSEVLLHAATAVALMAVVGYLYSASAMHGAMAIPSAFAMLLLGCGSLLSRPDRGLVRMWLSRSMGGTLARRLLPTAIAIPLALGWVRLAGQRMGLYGLELGTALLVMALIMTQVWTVAVTARALEVTEAERRRAQEALRTSQERLSLLLETDLIGVISVMGGHTIVDANRTFLEMVGHSREELPLDVDAISPPEWRGLSDIARKEIAARGVATPFEKEYLHRSGRRVPVLVGGAAVPGTQEVLAFVVDLSGKKGAELEMERMRIFLDSVIENIPNMVFVKEAKGLRFVRMNRAGEELLGWSRHDFLGKNDYDLFPEKEADFFTRKDREVLSSGGMLDIPEEPLRTRQGQTRILHTKKVPIVDAEGTPQFLLGISEDITERKEAERHVERLHEGLQQRTVELEAANQELEAFSYSVSHDLRAPLRHLDGFTDLLIRHAGSTLDDKGRRYLDILSSSAKHMGRLIDDLLAFSRMSRTEMQDTWVPLGPMVAEIRRMLEGSCAGRAIEWKMGALPEVQGDPAMLRLVFTNLLTNAVKYTGRRTQAVIEVGATETDAEWTVFVRDNGVGFDMTYAHKLFGVFQRLHRESDFEGTGIGLATVRRIIHRHGGKTWAEGELDRGATFHVSLPRRAAPVEERMAA